MVPPTTYVKEGAFAHSGKAGGKTRTGPLNFGVIDLCVNVMVHMQHNGTKDFKLLQLM